MAERSVRAAVVDLLGVVVLAEKLTAWLTILRAAKQTELSDNRRAGPTNQQHTSFLGWSPLEQTVNIVTTRLHCVHAPDEE